MQCRVGASIPSLLAYLVRAVAHSFPVVVLFAVLLVGISSLNADDGFNSSGLIASLFFYGALFQILLLRPRRLWSRTWETDDGKPILTPANLLRFLGVSLLFLIVIIVMPAILLAVLIPAGIPNWRDTFLGATFLVCIPWSGLILAVFGTQLPAAAMGRPMSPRKTLRAARKTGWTVLLQLALIALLVTVALYGAVSQFAPPTGQDWPSPVIPFALPVVEFIVTSLPVVLAIAILSRAYEQGYPPGDVSPGEPAEPATAPD